MSNATSRAESGSIYFTDPNAAKSNWILWGIGGAVIFALIFIMNKKN